MYMYSALLDYDIEKEYTKEIRGTQQNANENERVCRWIMETISLFLIIRVTGIIVAVQHT